MTTNSFYSWLLLGSVFITCFILTNAVPSLHQINNEFLNGTKCPVPTMKNVQCPYLCVADLSYCPPSFIPQCPTGTSWCADGKCKSHCLSSDYAVCSCLGANLLPCQGSPILSNLSSSPKDLKGNLLRECRKLFGSHSDSITVNSCPTLDTIDPLTYNEPRFIGFYSIMASYVLILLTFHQYKKANEKNIVTFKIIDDGGSEESLIDNSNDSPSSKLQGEVQFSGYKICTFGRITLWCTLFASVYLIGSMIICILDFYGILESLASPGYTMLWKNGLALAKSFVFLWHITAFWLVCLKLSSQKMSTYFKVLCVMSEASHIRIDITETPQVYLADGSRLTEFIRLWEDRIRSWVGQTSIVANVKVQRTINGTRYFEFRCSRYVFEEDTGNFEKYDIHLGRKNTELVSCSKGLTSEVAFERIELIGHNFISVPIPSFVKAFAQELASFFYIYQLMCLLCSYYMAYYYMALVHTTVILGSALVKVYLSQVSRKKIKAMAEYKSTCDVLRNDQWVSLGSDEIVPGDVIAVKDQSLVPCDAIVISGYIITDESSLTGESMPVRKFPLTNDENIYEKHATGKMNTLIAGSRVLQVHPSHNCDRVTALVTQTGIATDKGQLIQNILFPQPVSFIFNEHLKVVFLILILWSLILFGVALTFLGAANVKSWFYGIFTVAQILNPLIPAVLVIGQSVSGNRLRKSDIYCVDLSRIVMSGKLRIFCFDKTGTLTKEGLEFHSVHGITEDNGVIKLGQEVTHVPDAPVLLQLAMGSCHEVTELNGGLIGNPVDIEMFKTTGWQLSNEKQGCLEKMIPTISSSSSSILSGPIRLLRRFEFVHALSSMSVIVQDASKRYHVFVKGSFEVIHKKSTLQPANYDSITSQASKNGCYTLGFAWKEITDLVQQKGESFLHSMSREEVEEGVEILGLIMFRNNLKPDSKQAIEMLKQGGIRPLMITGDNIYTGIFISKACNMISATDGKYPPIAIGKLRHESPESGVCWCDWKGVSISNIHHFLQNSPGAELAVTGEAFRYLYDHNAIRQLLPHIRVFARMTPTQKVQCVQLHMEITMVGMCGDGGNDCGALRAAHVGLALSDSEASIVSPFSSKNRSVMSCVQLVREGRAALATSFAGYKFLIMQGETLAIMKCTGLYFSAVPTVAYYVFVDGIASVGLSYLLTQSLPKKRLTVHHPTANPLGAQTIASVMGQVVINMFFLFGSLAMLFRETWFRCNEFDATLIDITYWWALGDNFEMSVLDSVAFFQVIVAAASFNFGHYFRRKWIRNWRFALVCLALYILITYAVLGDPNTFGCMLRINCGNPKVLAKLGYSVPLNTFSDFMSPLGHNVFPFPFRLKLFALCVCNGLCVLLWEYCVVIGGVGRWAKLKLKKYKGRKKSHVTL